MGESNALEVLKQCFGKIVPEKDARAKICPLEFVVCFIFQSPASGAYMTNFMYGS